MQLILYLSLYMTFPSLLLCVSFCTTFRSSLRSDLKAFLFSLRRAFLLGPIQGKTPFLHVGHSIVHTVVNITSDAVGYAVNVLPMNGTELFPHSRTDTIIQSFFSLFKPSLHCGCHSWFSVYKGFIHRLEMKQDVI